MPVDDARKILDEQHVGWERSWGSGRLMKELYDEKVQHEVTGPLFCIDYPREVSPLARAHRDDPDYVERFELLVAGFELCNAYSEQNDPVQQLAAFEDEARAKQGGDPEAGDVDLDYIRALEYGLPPTGGIGIGIDRLIMLLASVDSIREVILFPTLRPEFAPPPGTGPHGGPRQLVPPTPLPAPRVGASPGSVAPLPPPRDGAAAPAVQRSRRPLRALAVLTAIGGVLQLLALLPGMHDRVLPLELVFAPFGFEIAGHVVSVIVGLLLILLANQLAKGKRAAWRIAVALFALGAVTHLLKGPHPIAVVFCVGMVAGPGATRDRFTAPTDPPSLLRLLWFVPIYLGAVLAFGFASLYAERTEMTPPLTFLGGLTTILGGLIEITVHLRHDGLTARLLVVPSERPTTLAGDGRFHVTVGWASAAGGGRGRAGRLRSRCALRRDRRRRRCPPRRAQHPDDGADEPQREGHGRHAPAPEAGQAQHGDGVGHPDGPRRQGARLLGDPRRHGDQRRAAGQPGERDDEPRRAEHAGGVRVGGELVRPCRERARHVERHPCDHQPAEQRRRRHDRLRERIAAGQPVQHPPQPDGEPEQQRDPRAEHRQPDAGGGLPRAVVEPLENGGVRHAWVVDADRHAQRHPNDEQHDRSGARPSRALKCS